MASDAICAVSSTAHPDRMYTHFFQKLQLHGTWRDASSSRLLVCSVSTVEQLAFALWLVNTFMRTHLDPSIHIVILYCTDNVWEEFSRSRQDPTKIEQESRRINWSVRHLVAHCQPCTAGARHCASLEIAHATSFLTDRSMSPEFLALPTAHERRHAVLQAMISDQRFEKKSPVLGHIALNSSGLFSRRDEWTRKVHHIDLEEDHDGHLEATSRRASVFNLVDADHPTDVFMVCLLIDT